MTKNREDARKKLYTVINTVNSCSNWSDRARMEEILLDRLDDYFKSFLDEYILELTVCAKDKKDAD